MKHGFNIITETMKHFEPKITAPETITVDLNALTFKPFSKSELSGVDEGEQDMTIELSADMGGNTIYITADICMSYEYHKGTGRLSDPPSERHSTLEPVSYDMKVGVSAEEGEVVYNLFHAIGIVRDFIKREIGI